MGVHVKSVAVGAASVVTVGALALGGAALASAGPQGPMGYATTVSTGQSTGSATGGPGTPGGGPGRHGRPGAPGPKDRVATHALTGETAVKVTQAAVAKEPTAYLLRVGKAEDGTYRAHMMRPDGTRIVLSLDANFTVTSVADAPKPARAPRPRPVGTSTSAPSST